MANQESGYFLYLMRHGIAVERGSPDYPDDGARPLTEKGRKRVGQIADGLCNIGFEADWIVTSPLVRARETAHVVAESIHARAPLDGCDSLAPGGSFGDLKEFLL